MPHICELPTQPNSLCSPRWQNTPFALTGITEKIQGTQQGHKMSHNVGTRLLSGFFVGLPVELWNGIAG